MYLEIKEIDQNHIGEIVTIQGWVTSNRDLGKIGFLAFNDGSCLGDFQIVYKENEEMGKLVSGVAVELTGEIVSSKGNQNLEMKLISCKVVNNVIDSYPLQKKQHSMEFLRKIAHLRSRTKTFRAIWKVRNELNFAIHHFYNKNGFYHVATPIITGNDCEGAGESFVVTNEKGSSKNNYETDFFKTKALLTVSGQLHAESLVQGLKKVYSFGPTFRAENSNTTRHAAEFWMLEPEMAFSDINKIMTHGEQVLKYCLSHILKTCKKELLFFQEHENISIKKLEELVVSKFQRVKYVDLVGELEKAIKNGHTFEENNIFIGMDFGSEHERYLCEIVYKSPIFATHFPEEIKAFYMKQSDDKRFVDSFDLFVPGIGELMGGSARENNPQILKEKAIKHKIKIAEILWYLDLRYFGSAPSAGFGLGFERLLMFITGINNIRDVIPFPRTPGKIYF